jgi:hypothetical protein
LSACGSPVSDRDNEDRRDVRVQGQKADYLDGRPEVVGCIAKVEDMRGGLWNIAVSNKDLEVAADVVRVQVVDLGVG